MVYGAIKGMVETLDPHSTFLRPEQYREMKNDTSGQFSGVCIEVDVRDGVLTVLSVMEGTPAARSGILPGDQILRIDDQRRNAGRHEHNLRVRQRGAGLAIVALQDGWLKPGSHCGQYILTIRL